MGPSELLLGIAISQVLKEFETPWKRRRLLLPGAGGLRRSPIWSERARAIPGPGRSLRGYVAQR